MYASTEDTKALSLEQSTVKLEESIAGLMDLIGPTREDRRRFFRPIDILTTPAEFLALVSAINGARLQVDTAIESIGAAKTFAGQTQG